MQMEGRSRRGRRRRIEEGRNGRRRRRIEEEEKGKTDGEKEKWRS